MFQTSDILVIQLAEWNKFQFNSVRDVPYYMSDFEEPVTGLVAVKPAKEIASGHSSFRSKVETRPFCRSTRTSSRIWATRRDEAPCARRFRCFCYSCLLCGREIKPRFPSLRFRPNYAKNRAEGEDMQRHRLRAFERPKWNQAVRESSSHSVRLTSVSDSLFQGVPQRRAQSLLCRTLMPRLLLNQTRTRWTLVVLGTFGSLSLFYLPPPPKSNPDNWCLGSHCRPVYSPLGFSNTLNHTLDYSLQ